MALDINTGYSNVFKTFVEFAEKTYADGYDSACARATLNGRQLTVSALSLYETSYVLRKTAEKEINNSTRTLFMNAIADMFGGEAKIPPSVKKAMILSDYGEGRPLTARRIIAVKNAIDADGAMRIKGASQFREAETRETALAMGYRETELPKLARAVNFYAITQGCTERDALNAVSEQGSKANRLMGYGGRFLESAENFADGLRLLDLFADWHEDLSTYVTTLRNATPMRSKRDYSNADTLTKLNAEFSYVTPECRAQHERFVFETLACDPGADLKATDAEKIFGVEGNSTTSFVCQGFGGSAWNTIAQIPPDRRAVVFKAFDQLCILARDPQAAKTDIGVRHFTVAGANISLARMIKNLDSLSALAAQGRLTARNIVATCFPDLHLAGRYETAKLHRAFLSFADVLSEDGAASLQIQKILHDTGCTLAEARTAYYEGVNLPTLPYVSSHQMQLAGLDNIDSARKQLKIDLSRPSSYSKTDAVDVPILDADQTCFRIMFPDGESFATDETEDGREKAERVVRKVEDLCGRVHPRQAAGVMSLMSQSGLAVLRGGLKIHKIHSTEHSAVDFTLTRDDRTGNITIRYSSPRALDFAFEWAATVKPDGSVTTTPLKFMDEIVQAGAV